jgi:FK506-binding nuclear protein
MAAEGAEYDVDGEMPEDFDPEDMEGMDMGGSIRPDDYFFKAKITTAEPTIIDSEDPSFAIKITNVTFGASVHKGSRTVLHVEQQEDEDDADKGVICVLREGAYETHATEILVADPLRLSISGTKPSDVYISGYYSPIDQHFSDPATINSLMSRAMGDMESIDGDELSGADEEMDFEDDDDEDVDDEEMLAEIRAKLAAAKSKKGGKRKRAESEEDDVKVEDTKKESKPDTPSKKKKTNSGKAEAVQEKKAEKAEEPKKSEKSKKKPKWQTVAGGLKFKDMKEGTGKAAKKGDKVTVYYVGQLEDKTVFDKTISGEGFTFTLGAGEVIDGWDKGIKGMSVGTKRRLEVPPKLGYGREGAAPEIPPNAKLMFTVECRAIN